MKATKPPRSRRNRLVGLLASAQDRLRLEELLQTKDTPLPSGTGLLVASEPSILEIQASTVQVDVAGPELLGDLAGRGEVLGVDVARKAVDRVVSDLDGLLQVVVRDHAEDGAKDLLAGNGHLVVDVGENGRLDVVTGSQPLGPARSTNNGLGAFVDTLLQEGLDLLVLGTVGDRADGALLSLLGRLDLDGRSDGSGNLDSLVVRVLVNEHTRRSVAGLAGVGHHGEDTGGDGLLKRSVGGDDVGRLAAKLLSNALDGSSGSLGNEDTGAGRASEGLEGKKERTRRSKSVINAQAPDTPTSQFSFHLKVLSV